MARHAQEVTDTELSVLEMLWEHGDATIRQLTDALYPNGGASHYATVQKLLERLEAKGFVKRDRSQAVHVFSAAVERQDLIGRRLRSVAEKLCGGSLASLATHLVRTQHLSAEDRRKLRDLIDQLDREGQGENR